MNFYLTNVLIYCEILIPSDKHLKFYFKKYRKIKKEKNMKVLYFFKPG